MTYWEQIRQLTMILRRRDEKKKNLIGKRVHRIGEEWIRSI